MNIRNFLSGGGRLFATRGLTVGLNFLTMLMIAYLMGIVEYGRFAVVWAGGNIAASIMSFGLPNYLLREFSIREKMGDNGVTPRLLLEAAVLLPALMCIALYLAAEGLRMGGLGEMGDLPNDLVPLILGLGFLLNLNTNFSSAFHAFGLQSFSMFQRDALPQGLALGAVAVAVAFGAATQTAVLLLIGLLAVWSLLAVVSIASKSRHTRLFGTGHKTGSNRFAFWGSTVLGTLLAQIDIMVGSLFMSSAELGAYNILRRVANLAALPVTIATWATVGDFSRAFASNDRKAIDAANRRALMLALPPGAGLIGICLALYPVIMLVYDIPQGQMLFAAYLLLLMQSAVLVFFGATMVAASTSGLERWALYGRMFGVFSYLGIAFPALTFAFVPTLGNATAVLVSAVAVNVLVWWRVRVRYNLDTSGMVLVRRAGPG